MADGEAFVLPDYAGRCVTNVVPALLGGPTPAWLPPEALSEQVVLLVLDGLGWLQLQERLHCAPTLASLAGGPITTVAPSTTATALTSISTGLPPGEHGIVGYRIHVQGDVLNVLRWTTKQGDSRLRHVPALMQTQPPFGNERPPIVTRAEFSDSGFTAAHLLPARFFGYRMASSLVTQVLDLVVRGEPFVYAYYEGIDKVAHEYGLNRFYEAELRAVDRIVEELLTGLPAGVSLVVTADHGQIETGEDIVELHPSVLAHVALQSGEGRFRWLHARAGRAAALREAVETHHGSQAWVRSREETIAEGWFGPVVTEDASRRLGDVALVAKGHRAFHDPTDTGAFKLIGRHGSLTAAEMLVPLLAARV